MTEKKGKAFSDADYIEGAYQCIPQMERELHKLCKRYYDKNFNKPKLDKEGRKDIFQSSLLSLWSNIRNRRVYVEDGEVKGQNGQPFTSTLTTYFMAIVNYNYLGWIHKNHRIQPVDITKNQISDDYCEEENVFSFKYDDDTIRKFVVIENRINHMAKQCYKILTLYYYEEKDYEEMMGLLTTFKSKDALKTAKYKCLKRLHDSVNGTFLQKRT